MVKTAIRKPTPTKGSNRGKDSGQGDRGKRTWADVIPGVVDDFAVPHLGVGGVAGLSLLLHNKVVDNTTSLIALSLTALGFFVILPFVVWHYAEARKKFQRVHAVLTPVLAGLGSLGWQIIGVDQRWVAVYVGLGIILALTWNVRRAQVIKGDGGDDHERTGWDELFGVPGSTIEILEDTAVRRRFRWTGINGQTQADFKGALPKIESAARAVRGAARMVPEKAANMAIGILIKIDVLKAPPVDPDLVWDGVRVSFSIGQSIALSENGKTISLTMAGADTWGASHTQIMGMTRSGKSHCFRLWVQKMSRTNDAVIWAVDVIKGKQTLAPLLPAIDWLAMDKPEAAALLTALRGDKTRAGVIKERGDYLGARGLDDWVPGCGIPALIVWIEEAAQLGLGELFVRLVESGLSVGVFIVSSMQRAHSENIPTSARAQFGSAVCFGVNSDTDSGFVLDEEINSIAIAHQWKGREKGRCYIDGPSLDDEMKGSPARTFNTSPDVIAAQVTANAPGMCQLDELTANAAGQAYANRTYRSPVLAGTCPSDPKVDVVKRDLSGHSLVPAPRRPDQNTLTTPVVQPDQDDDTDYDEEDLMADQTTDDELTDDPLGDDVSVASLPPAYPGADEDMTKIEHIGYKDDLPAVDGEVVFRQPSLVKNRLRGQARHEAWEQTLAEVAAAGDVQQNGWILVTMENILDAWIDDPDAGRERGIDMSTRPWIYTRLDTLMQNGLIERLDPAPGEGGRGRYLLSGTHDWAGGSLPVTEGEMDDASDNEEVSPVVEAPVSL